MDENISNTKVCNVCGARKPLADFWINRSLAVGRCGGCIRCLTEKQRAKRAESAKPRPTLEERFWAKVSKKSGVVARDDLGECWVWVAALDNHGYGLFGDERAHRASWELANGPIPEGLCVCHHCDNPPCIRPDHLFVGTMGDNMRDKTDKGRARGATGVSHPKAKLTEAEVLEIRSRRASGETLRAISERFGVSGPVVHRIAVGKIWKHI